MATEFELMAYRVRRDAVRAPEGWQPIFEQLAERLFDPELRVKALRKAHRLARTAATRAFEKVFGCEPGEYVTRRRIETFKALLRIEGLTIWACAEWVGFTSPSGFEAAYKRLCDETPKATRAHLAAAGKMMTPESAAKSEEALRWLFSLQKPTTIAETCRALRERSHAALREQAEAVESWEQLLVDEWWTEVKEQPITELWALIDGRLETAALFEVLWRASREEGRRTNRQRGVEIAELSLESLGLLRGQLAASQLAEFEVKTLAELGNAYRLVHDFPAAEQAFAAAEKRLEVCSDATIELRADVFALEASLYHDEGRLEEALALTCCALPLAGNERVLRAEILLLQASLLVDLGQIDQPIVAFRTAFELLSPEAEPYLAWVALQNLALACHKIGDGAAARSWLERAEPIVRSLGQLRPICLRDWLAGLLAANQGDLEQAELHLCRAHAGYERLKDLAHGGVISLDLAALYLRLERPAEAAQLASEALPQLASLGLTSEGIVALSLLHQALEAKTLSTAVLERVRGCIARMVSAPELEPAAER